MTLSAVNTSSTSTVVWSSPWVTGCSPRSMARRVRSGVRGHWSMIVGLELALRAGVHSGEVAVIDDDIAGVAVHIGARVRAKAAAGEVLVSSPGKDLVVGSE